MFFGPYVPDKILKAVAVYIHRRNLHPSATQTIKEFKAYYYHPIADRVVKGILQKLYYMHTNKEQGKKEHRGR